MTAIAHHAALIASASVPAATYLDELSIQPTAVFSLKKRISTATKSIRVRRSSDNTEQDIGFVGNALDSTALLAFAGSGDAFVTTFYDQKGTNNATQSTTANQPQIVAAGVSLGVLQFDGTNDGMQILPSLTLTGLYLGVYWNVAMKGVSTGNPILFEMGSDFVGGSSSAARAASFGGPEGGAQWTVQTKTASARRHVYNFNWATALDPISMLFDLTSGGTNQIMVYEAGSLLTPYVGASNSAGTGFGTQAFNVGRRNNASFSARIDVTDLYVYSADTSAIRASIEAIRAS